MDKANPRDIETDEERDKLLEGLSSLPYHERLTRFLRGSTRHWVTAGVNVVDFRPLYSVTIHHLQRQMAEEIHDLTNNEVTDQQLVRIRDILHHYTNALRDFEFIHANRWNTFFVKDIAASRMDDGPGSKLHAALMSELDLAAGDSHRSIYQDADLLGSFNPKLMQHSTAIGRSLGTGLAQTFSSQERRLNARRASKRFGFAAIGGLIIVVPMLILASGTATAKMQAVISASIFVFAGGVALFSTTEPENLLVVTAAYAAVLVAFIAEK
ncbi:hypothetical protein NW768_011240 [Fusarium equiseti]|uniref:DUF6594 domain-containing protein n=1 Tax=Fusarium equiseti TaxID=61235 RepID=A0ABQ8QYA2_FUSEQ|nr:hypothetical protein NW768_011240 [Fusarium equiseti]